GVVLLCLGVKLTPTMLWIPALLVVIVTLAAGLGMFLAAASLFYRDVRYLVELGLTFAIFVTPVFFETAIFQDWQNVLLLNPVAPILEAFPAAVLDQGVPNLAWLGYSTAVAILTLTGAYVMFRRVEPAFAECI